MYLNCQACVTVLIKNWTFAIQYDKYQVHLFTCNTKTGLFCVCGSYDKVRVSFDLTSICWCYECSP